MNCRQDAQLMLSAVNLPGGIQVCQKLCVLVFLCCSLAFEECECYTLCCNGYVS